MEIQVKLNHDEIETIVVDEMHRKFPGYKASVTFSSYYSYATVDLEPVKLDPVPALVAPQAE